jgi:hypothetical protein
MENARHEIRNITKVDHPINLDRFKQAFPGVFEEAGTLQKGTAKAALMTKYKMSAKVAEVQLSAVCDDIPSGPPVWDLAVKKPKGGI